MSFWTERLLVFPQLFSNCFVSRALRLLQCGVFQNMESLKLWIALAPKQLEELNKGNEVFPDGYSGRFRSAFGTCGSCGSCPILYGLDA